MRVRLADIAARTGLAIPTVSEVLSGKSNRSYREETRRRVLRAADELGYRANRSARSMRSGKFSAIALICGEQGSAWSWATHAMTVAIERALARKNQHLVLGSYTDNQLTRGPGVSRVLQELMVDGLLMNCSQHTPSEVIDSLQESQLPIVWLNTLRNRDCVYIDNIGGASTAVSMLAGLGHRRIVYLGAQRPLDSLDELHHAVRERLSGYLTSIASHGLTAAVVPYVPGISAEHPLDQMLQQDDRPTAVICHHVELAYQAACLASRRGLDVPADLSIVALGPEQLDSDFLPLTRVVVREQECAEVAVSAVLQKIEDPDADVSPRIISMCLVDREASVAPPRPVSIR
jgi:DNA-binding LacI/PurR family transcriptional regulator